MYHDHDKGCDRSITHRWHDVSEDKRQENKRADDSQCHSGGVEKQ